VFRSVNFHSGLISSNISADALHLDLVIADMLVHLLNVGLSNFNLRNHLGRTLFLEHGFGLRLSHSGRVALAGASKEIVNGLKFLVLGSSHGLAAINNLFLEGF